MTTPTPTQAIQPRVMADLERMLAELRINELRNELVHEINAAILRSTFSPQQVLDLIVEKCLSRTESDHGQIVLYRQGRLVVAASSEPMRVGQELPLRNSLSGTAVRERAEQHYSDVSTLPASSYVRYHETTKTELVVLIQPANEARVLGVIDLERDVERPFSEAALAFAHLLAGQAAIAIEHARIAMGIKTLYEISNAVASGALTLQQGFHEILTSLLSNSDFEQGQILIREGDKLVIVASSRGEDIGLRLGTETSVGRYLIAEQGRAILMINDIERSVYRDVYVALLAGEGEPMRSEMIVPLIGESGTIIGVLNVESPNVGVFTAPDVSFFGAVGGFLSGAISAGLARQKRMQTEQIRTADLAMTQLGNAAQSFLHRFGGAIGNVHGRLIELRAHLSGREVPPVRRDTVAVGEFIQEMVDNLEEAAKAIEDFGNRFDPRAAEFQFQNVNLATTGEDLVRKYRRKYADTGIDFAFENQLRIIERSGRLLVNSTAICRLTDQVNEVIENLLDNAVRAITDRPSGWAGKVTVTVRLSDALGAQLRVTDNGVGIPEKIQPSIFGFGYTTRKGDSASQGIGLWFCQNYAFQVGGKLAFKSVEGEGSWFEIEFPTIEG